jgi:hypothetical protein
VFFSQEGKTTMPTVMQLATLRTELKLQILSLEAEQPWDAATDNKVYELHKDVDLLGDLVRLFIQAQAETA